MQVNASLLARNAARNLLGLAVPLLVALAAVPVLVGTLGTTRFGVLALAWVCYGMLAELGLGRATTKYAASAFAAGDDVRPVVRTGVRLQLVLGMVLGATLALIAAPLAARIAGAEGFARETRDVLLIIAATLPLIMLAAAYRGVLEAAHRFDLVNRVRIPLTTSTYLVPALLVLAGAGVVAMVLALGVARVIGTLAYARLARGVLALRSERQGAARAFAPVASMLSFGAWQTAGGLLAPLLVYLDRFLLAALAGVTAVGLYTPAFDVATKLLIIPASVVMALFPAFSAWSAGEVERSARTAARATLYITAALAPIVVLVAGVGTDALRLWLDAEFARQAGTALTILACGMLANAAALVPATLLQGAGRPDVVTKLYAAELPLYVVVMFVLIPRYGVTGAALAWSARVVVDAALLFGAAHRLHILPFQELTRSRVPQSLLGAGAFAVTAGVAAQLDARLWTHALVTALAFAACCVFLWSYSLRAEGRARLAEALGLASA